MSLPCCSEEQKIKFNFMSCPTLDICKATCLGNSRLMWRSFISGDKSLNLGQIPMAAFRDEI